MWWRWPPHSRRKSGKSCRAQSTLHLKTFAHTPSSGTEPHYPPPPLLLRIHWLSDLFCPNAAYSPSSEYCFVCVFIRWSNHSMARSALDRHAIPLFFRNCDHLPAEFCLHFATTNSHLPTHAHDILYTCSSNPTVVPRCPGVRHVMGRAARRCGPPPCRPMRSSTRSRPLAESIVLAAKTSKPTETTV